MNRFCSENKCHFDWIIINTSIYIHTKIDRYNGTHFNISSKREKNPTFIPKYYTIKINNNETNVQPVIILNIWNASPDWHKLEWIRKCCIWNWRAKASKSTEYHLTSWRRFFTETFGFDSSNERDCHLEMLQDFDYFISIFRIIWSFLIQSYWLKFQFS